MVCLTQKKSELVSVKLETTNNDNQTCSNAIFVQYIYGFICDKYVLVLLDKYIYKYYKILIAAYQSI